MSEDRRRRPRTALVCLRALWLYGERSNSPQPGTQGLVDVGQLRAIRRAVRQARDERRLKRADAELELAEIQKGLEIVAAGPLRDVGVYFPPIEDCFTPPPTKQVKERRRAKAARKARKAQRKKKR